MTHHNNIFDKLESAQHSDSFKVPEGYFDSLQKRIEQRIEQQEANKPKGKVILLKTWLSVAAAVALIVIAVRFIVVTTPDNATLASAPFTENNQLMAELMEMNDEQLMLMVASDENIKIETPHIDMVSGLTPEDLESLVLF